MAQDTLRRWLPRIARMYRTVLRLGHSIQVLLHVIHLELALTGLSNIAHTIGGFSRRLGVCLLWLDTNHL